VLCNGLEQAMAKTDAVVGAVGSGVGAQGSSGSSCEDIIDRWEDVRRNLLLALRYAPLYNHLHQNLPLLCQSGQPLYNA